MPESSYIYLTLAGDFIPEEVSSMINLEPWQSYLKHSRSQEHRLPRTSRLSYARLDTDDDIPDIYDLSEKLVDILEPVTSEITAAVQKFDIQCCCSICLYFTIDDAISTPIIGFSKRVTKFLADVDASIDIDTYRID